MRSPLRSVYLRIFVTTLLAAAALVVQAQAQSVGMVLIKDTAEGGGPGGGLFYMVTSVNGTDLAETALSSSMRASAGRGPYMVVQTAQRMVPAGEVVLTLRGVQGDSAPVHTLFRAIFKGGNPEVTGEVKVDLVAGKQYQAKGVLDAFRKETWLEDDAGIEVPRSRITSPPDPELVKAMEGALFVTTNLRFEGDWISEAPSLHNSFVPAGSRMKVIDWGSNRASVLIDGRKMRVGVDHSRKVETIQQVVARMTSSDDPRPKIMAYPETVRNAVRAGRVLAGMNREQVLHALGRPRLDFTPSLEAEEWRYQVPEQEDVFIVFDAAGLLKEVDGSRKARKLVLYEK